MAVVPGSDVPASVGVTVVLHVVQASGNMDRQPQAVIRSCH